MPVFHIRPYFVALLLLVAPLDRVAASDEQMWTIEHVDQMIADIRARVSDGRESPAISEDHPLIKGLFDKLINLAVKLGQKTTLKLCDVADDAVALVINLQDLKNQNHANIELAKDGKSATVNYYTKFDKDLADELGLGENHKVFEVEFLFAKKFLPNKD